MDETKASLTGWVRSLQSDGLVGAAGSSGRFWTLLVTVALSAALLLLLLYRIRRFGLRRALRVWRKREESASIVMFYERMTKLLERQGMRREKNETPLEFAGATGIADVLRITRAYNRVRYGSQTLSPVELTEIEQCLTRLEGEVKK
jgi:glycine/D-amino acid oxidase-like deaminating enzyme